jgi:uncharacterized RDD family membrane protein YckC
MDQQHPSQRTQPSDAAPGYQPPVVAGQQFAVRAGPGQPEHVKRFVAYFIDAVILGVLANLPIPLIGLLGAVAATGGWLLRDTLLEHRSVGKKVMGLQAVGAGGRPVTMEESIKRNLPFALFGVAAILGHLTIVGALLAVPVSILGACLALVEGVLVLTGNVRLGDRFAGTHVVDTQVQPAVQG